MRYQQTGGKPDIVVVSVRNTETSEIPYGTPLILAMNGTDDGLAVVLPSSAGAIKSNALLFGVAGNSIPAGGISEAIAYGIVNSARILVATRAASSDSWSSSISLASFGALVVDTINNVFTLQTASNDLGEALPNAVLLQSIAAVVASASATTDSRTAYTTTKRIFVRMI
jgi:hypothetical protein